MQILNFNSQYIQTIKNHIITDESEIYREKKIIIMEYILHFQENK